MQEADRPALCRMLEEDSDDFPPQLLYLYQRARSPYPTFIARRGGRIDGLLDGSFNLDLADGDAFGAFDLPPEPHAFLTRIQVRRPARDGVGRALIEAYANAASARGCTFIGGSIDLSSDPTGRIAFFEAVGFTIRQRDNFGARPHDILEAIARRSATPSSE
jgi:GNAT superfamily N-acetyltransferase